MVGIEKKVVRVCKEMKECRFLVIYDLPELGFLEERAYTAEQTPTVSAAGVTDPPVDNKTQVGVSE